VQWYEYTGSLGGSLWILLVNLLAYLFTKNIIDRNEKRIRILNSILTLSGTLLLIASPIFVSHLIYQKRPEQGVPCQVVIVQPNIDPYNEKFSGSATFQIEKFISLAKEQCNDSTDFVVGPETALPDGMWEEEIYYHPHIHQLLKWIDDYPHLNLFTGLSSFKAFDENEKPTLTARRFTDSDKYYDAYNTAMMIDRYGAIQLFHKSKLVPGVEKMPYPKVFGFLEDYAIKLGGTSGSLGKQEIRNPLVSPEGISVAPAVCYESVFGDYLSTYFRKGAELLFIITNDGWWKNTPGHRQHMEYARLRAIEFRKDIARSANTGISCFIDQRGNILARTTWWQPASIRATLHRNATITFYAYHGDYIGFICAFLAALIILLLIFRRFVPSR
jgi:apolipoprotein N-acyltransferase